MNYDMMMGFLRTCPSHKWEVEEVCWATPAENGTVLVRFIIEQNDWDMEDEEDDRVQTVSS